MTDLEQSLTRKKRTKSDTPPSNPLPIKQWFKDKGIPNIRLAERLSVSAICISRWLNGTVKVPKDRFTQLLAIITEIKEWEKEHGREFNSGLGYISEEEMNSSLPLQETVSVCPYEDRGVKFGTDFDDYDVCVECSYREPCKKAQ